MDKVIFGSKAFSKGLGEKALNNFLTCLYSNDIDILRAYPSTVKLYDSGVRYKEEPLGQEKWNDIFTVLEKTLGDCEDLACWRAAELTASGVEARPVFRLRQFGELKVYHILVQHPDGLLEDPSTVLGMKPFNPASPYQWRE